MKILAFFVNRPRLACRFSRLHSSKIKSIRLSTCLSKMLMLLCINEVSYMSVNGLVACSAKVLIVLVIRYCTGCYSLDVGLVQNEKMNYI